MWHQRDHAPQIRVFPDGSHGKQGQLYCVGAKELQNLVAQAISEPALDMFLLHHVALLEMAETPALPMPDFENMVKGEGLRSPLWLTMPRW